MPASSSSRAATPCNQPAPSSADCPARTWAGAWVAEAHTSAAGASCTWGCRTCPWEPEEGPLRSFGAAWHIAVAACSLASFVEAVVVEAEVEEWVAELVLLSSLASGDLVEALLGPREGSWVRNAVRANADLGVPRWSVSLAVVELLRTWAKGLRP